MGNIIAIICHLLAINIWIGGTFYSVVILPRAIASLPFSEQYLVLCRTLSLFFRFVWIAVIMLLASGGWMVLNVFHGLGHAPLYVTVMIVIALLMMLVFSYIYFTAFRKFRRTEVEAKQKNSLATIRKLSKVNMVLGICIVLVIGGGPHFLV